MRNKRGSRSVNQFRHYAHLQKRVSLNKNNRLIEDYKTVTPIRLDIKAKSATQKSFESSIDLESDHKIWSRYIRDKIDPNWRFILPFNQEVFRIEAFVDKNERKEYLEFDCQKNVYTTKTTVQPTAPLVYAKLVLKEASFGANPETDQLSEIATEFDKFDKVVMAHQRFQLDNYSFVKNIQFIADEQVHQFLYVFFRKTDLESLETGRVLTEDDDSSPPKRLQDARPEFDGLDYSCFKVNNVAFDEFLGEEF